VLIQPAIDIRDGRCVRLRQGDFAQETVFGDDPAAAARRWVDQGAKFLHLVDLDGAREGRLVNGESIRRIVQAAGVPCQLGGGVRDDAQVAAAFELGVERIVVGTRALKDLIWLEQVCRRFPRRVALGLDARNGCVATDGWTEVTNQLAVDVARHCGRWPLAALVYTDIGCDGMMLGPNIDALAELKSSVDLPVIASGGVTTARDVRRLARLGVAGCIIGRALYDALICPPPRRSACA
jgi:phosphoribosylformimino-5-aminoimidazole carboxamide ribotide isomerase